MCPFCHSKCTRKNGTRNGKQRYRCQSCRKQLEGGNRLNAEQLWQLYTQGKQTTEQLAKSFGCSRKTISRYLGKAQTKFDFAVVQTANILMDTTYFGRQYGIMVLYDSISKQALFVEEVRYESNALYLEAIRSLQTKGIHIQSITCDGRRGLEKLFPDIPTQPCRFHQVQIIQRYLTRRPKSPAACELKALALILKNSSQQGFETALEAWYERHKAFLNERTTSPVTHKSRYSHSRLRSACHSLKRNLPHLFTFERHPDLGILNTINLLEGKFADLKAKLRCHQGMKKENKIQFIKDYFSKKRLQEHPFCPLGAKPSEKASILSLTPESTKGAVLDN